MGTIPGGTSNIWAREIDLDKKPVEAVQRMVFGDRRLIDTGKAGDRHFVHDYVLAGVATAGMDPGEAAGTREGNALVAHA